MKSTLCLLLASLMTSTATAATPPVPPDVEKRPHVVKAPFGATRNDDYYWLRDDKREDKAMLAYLQAENAYTDQVVAPLKPLQETLYKEIVARIKQDDSSVPARERGYWYYSRFETGQDYPIHARRKGDMQAAEASGCVPHLVCTGRHPDLLGQPLPAGFPASTRVHADLAACADHLLGAAALNTPLA